MPFTQAARNQVYQAALAAATSDAERSAAYSALLRQNSEDAMSHPVQARIVSLNAGVNAGVPSKSTGGKRATSRSPVASSFAGAADLTGTGQYTYNADDDPEEVF